MSGHSKWATIKHKKAATDAKRGKTFTKLIKEISVAAKMGGSDPNTNPRLRMAMMKAKEANMPSDNVERAIKKGAGELEGVTYEDIVYEGYGPDAVAVMIDVLTDNRNRTVAEIRKILSKAGGNLGAEGSVAWMFEKKGIINIPKGSYNEDQVMEAALEAGASDMTAEDEYFEITTAPEDYETVKTTLAKSFTIESSEILRVAKNTVKLDTAKSERIVRLVDTLEEHDDVQSVSVNLEFDESMMND